MRYIYIHFNLHHNYLEKVFLSNYAFITGMFFAVFIEGNMPGSHNLKYYVELLKRNKVQSHITKHY